MTEKNEVGHVSVLLQESIDGLDLKAGDIFVDGTLGSGGHSLEVARRFGPNVRIIGIDKDQDAITRTKKRFKKSAALADFVESDFKNIDAVLDMFQIEHPTKILLDLGLSSNQFETSGRGFSFQKDEPLEMTFKKSPTEEDLTAATILNEWAEETIETILRGFAEERYAKHIAKGIVARRAVQPFRTTGELVETILEATPPSYHHRKIHPATKTFQALRIAANDELGSLRDGLERGFNRLASGGRIAVISFHSLEDRIVKRFFKEKTTQGVAILVNKKPITPSSEELDQNKRARSAKLRILEKS